MKVEAFPCSSTDFSFLVTESADYRSWQPNVQYVLIRRYATELVYRGLWLLTAEIMGCSHIVSTIPETRRFYRNAFL